MSFPRSWTGGGLAVVYLVVTIYMAQEEIRHTGGGWINLRGLGTNLLTAPSQLTLGVVLKNLGVPRINYDRPGATGYGQLLLHVAVTALLIYLIGWGVEWLIRRILQQS